MRVLRFATSCALLITAAGCYHATVETGLTPSNTVIDIPWAHGFVYGLVPPSPVNAMSRCPGGVAKVETEHSFINQLAQFLTFGLYTPIHIKVTCAGGGRTVGMNEHTIDLGAGASEEQIQHAFEVAASIARRASAPVYVSF